VFPRQFDYGSDDVAAAFFGGETLARPGRFGIGTRQHHWTCPLQSK